MEGSLQPISIEALRRHFAEAYKLTPSQVDSMVASACKSVVEAMQKGDSALIGKDKVLLVDFAHSLKGVLLNMGQWEWAEIARQLEMVAKGADPSGLGDLVQVLRGGVKELVVLHQKEGDKQ